ncbi:MAG: glycosyltransferase family 2 protein [Parvularculaceae bacterium]|nr:glycosyltransferase family 2 protein [Parvularculaceae bacterium]
MNQESRFGAVIVNYNCGPFALDAALSFIGAGGAAAIIVDNASTDGSAEYIERALAGDAIHESEAPSLPFEKDAPSIPELSALAPGAVRLVRAPCNGGFAYGCNTGLRLLSAMRNIDRLLLLNPDALLSRRALAAFAERLADARAGLCGASVVAFDAPHPVQAFGGAALHPLLLVGANIGEGGRLSDAPDRRSVEERMSYPLGAAIAFRRDYLSRAGFLDERYFLYYEEADWTLAGGPANGPAWAPGAIVYHRYGASSKSARRGAGEASARSPLADFHMARSRIAFALKWRPALAPLAYLGVFAQAGVRLARGRPENAAALIRSILPGRKSPTKPRAYAAAE